MNLPSLTAFGMALCMSLQKESTSKLLFPKRVEVADRRRDVAIGGS